MEGIVQGVGFRPFVFGLASRLELRGFVKNHTGGVLIEVEGDVRSLDNFLAGLSHEAPPLARVHLLTWATQPLKGERLFRIESSETQAVGPIFISRDVATCEDCLAELFDPDDRRYYYPFLNCTNCGPRLTIVNGAPYDRTRTTMASFPMCPECRAEYENPRNRRFHAQPTCCPSCGPRLQVLDSQGHVVDTVDPLACFIAAIRAGKIGALKGLGGYHLVCDARAEDVVEELRRRKHRDEKPFAVMVRDLSAARSLCEVHPAERDLLLSTRRPIVLMRKRPATELAEAVAPRNPYLGVMLPYTPVHHLLLQAVGSAALVMTSGNRADEPIAHEDADAWNRLSDIADLFLIHDRPIHVRCDDSVTRLVDGHELPVRRSRGYAPEPLPLPLECPHPTLAVGGQFKGAFALGRGSQAFLSHHLGDLDQLTAFQVFTRDIVLYQQLFGIEPVVIAHDLHPDYASTRYARLRLTDAPNTVRLVAVQHHHAHLASCMAENGLREPVLGVTFDGTGYGTDGAIWGGEFLVGDYRQFRRAAHLRYVGLPGGDTAIREPWRMALAHLIDAQGDLSLLEQLHPPAALRVVRKMIEQRFNTPLTSSAGRLFDAIAALAGVRSRVSYEGQAAIELEWLASGVGPDGVYPFELAASTLDDSGANALEVDTRPLILATAKDARAGVAAAQIARRFHTTMLEMIAAVCERLRKATGLDAVALSGGVFMNALLSGEVTAKLCAAGFRVYRHRLVPPNDGGLSLGQLAVAAALSQEENIEKQVA